MNNAEVALEEVTFDVVNRVGLITLNRPKAHNALSHGMVQALSKHLSAWAVDPHIFAVVVRGAGEKAFCAGGDVRALYQSYRNKTPLYREFFVDEYRLNYAIHRYPKPYAAIMDGIVMGGGMGIAQGAALRLVTERSQIAMPETGIGLFPDVGASYFLGRMPVELSLYLGIAGVTIRAADVLFAGLADACVPSASLSDLEGTLANIVGFAEQPVKLRDALLTNHSIDSNDSSLKVLLPAIVRHFNAALSVAEMIASLESESDPQYVQWARKTAETLHARSPLMMCVTRKQLLRGRAASLGDCLRMELDLMLHAFDNGDFIEGVRASIIDKDSAPVWRAATLAQVRDEAVNAFFKSPWTRDDHPLRDLI